MSSVRSGFNVGLLGWTVITLVVHGVFGPFVSSSTCRTLDGFSIVFDLMMLIVCLRQIYAPLERETRDFTCCCSWMMLITGYGLYCVVIIALSFPGVGAGPDPAVLEPGETAGPCMALPLLWLLLMYTITSLAYLIVVMAGAVLYACIPTHWRRQHDDSLSETHRARNHGLSRAQLDAIVTIYVQPPPVPVGVVNPEGGEAYVSRHGQEVFHTVYQLEDASAPKTAELDKCSICLEICAGQIKKLPCGHMFHSECVEPWLAKHNQCALCRQMVVRA